MKPTRRPTESVSVRNRDVPMNAQSSHKWWSTITSAVFGLCSSMRQFVGGGDGLVCWSVGKADQMSDKLTAAVQGVC